MDEAPRWGKRTDEEIMGRFDGFKEMVTGRRRGAAGVATGPAPGRKRRTRASTDESKGTLSMGLTFTDKIPHPANMLKYESLNRDGEVETAISMLTRMVAGPGFHTKMPDKHVSKDPETPHANKVEIDEYNEKWNIDEKLEMAVRVHYEKGFAPIEKLESGDLKILPPETFFVYRDEKGNDTKYTQEWNTKVMAEWIGDEMSDVIRLVHKETPNNPYGKAVADCIAERIYARRDILEDVPDVIHKQGYPFRVFRSATEDIHKIVYKEVTEKEPDEDVYFYNMTEDELTIHTELLQPRIDFTGFITNNDEQIAEALNAPLPIYLRNATQASAETILETIERRIEGDQRNVKRRIEGELWEPIVGDPVPRLIFGMPLLGVEDNSLQEYGDLYAKGAVTFPQVQDLLKKKGLPLIETADPGLLPIAPGISPDLIAPDIKLALNVVKTGYDEKKLTLTEALTEAGKIINTFVERERLKAINKLSQSMGETITKLSSESENYFILMRNEIFNDFRHKLLPTGVKGISGERPTEYRVQPIYRAQ